MTMSSNVIPLVVVHSSNATAPMGSSFPIGLVSLKNSGLSIFRGLHCPVYAGFLIRSAFHTPLNSGFLMSGASHSPSISASQSSGIVASGSGIVAASTHSSGLMSSGSSMNSASTQSSGLLSSGSSIFSDGISAGLKRSAAPSPPASTISPSTLIENDSLPPCSTSVSRCVLRSRKILCGSWMRRAWTSEYSPVTGLLNRKINRRFCSPPHLSGPKRMVYGVLSATAARSRSSAADSNLRYDPPHPIVSLNCTVYCITTSPSPSVTG
mmetsp:Transcript_3242/g.9906  ORF Transcript_3242/g.9906 Transcript_3242/m.9906 type:complete len:267 (+) Transcript_3242:152-952(+)